MFLLRLIWAVVHALFAKRGELMETVSTAKTSRAAST